MTRTDPNPGDPGEPPRPLPVGSDRNNNPGEDADPDALAAGVEEPVQESEGFPGAGADTRRGGGGVIEGGKGSTGRNATDSGRADAGGTPGGASAGSSGG